MNKINNKVIIIRREKKLYINKNLHVCIQEKKTKEYYMNLCIALIRNFTKKNFASLLFVVDDAIDTF
jgi:hypothetical protein